MITSFTFDQPPSVRLSANADSRAQAMGRAEWRTKGHASAEWRTLAYAYIARRLLGWNGFVGIYWFWDCTLSLWHKFGVD
ncbi:hypothetical protein ml_391 [Mollivirus sibericum]|uniref:hypothetical protein n=1 Tax=Mollivirus sibericum TaxID=1678078 RepID=UPI0006B2DEEE|nr:hypothetical protein ml_391 [Mollivirus sibericum]ALD62193.1 hypothetical protein ml_391 [Mollivirus sibericum]